MKSRAYVFLATAALLAGTSYSLAQRGGPPRRIENPETIHLSGGSRVEFHSMESACIGGPLEYSVFLPPSYDAEPNRKYPTVYLLHGLFNDHTSWAVERYGNLPKAFEDAMKSGKIPECLVVSPNGGRSFYNDTPDGKVRYEEAIWNDLTHEMEADYRALPQREARALAGTSMGAYGALKIAFKKPEFFATVVAGSPIVFLGDDPMASLPASDSDNRFGQYLSQLIHGIFGDPIDKNRWLHNSLEQLAKTSRLDRLHIYFFYGSADRYGQFIPLDKGVKALDHILTERGIQHRFDLIDNGPHGWELIDGNLDNMLGFLTQTF